MTVAPEQDVAVAPILAPRRAHRTATADRDDVVRRLPALRLPRAEAGPRPARTSLGTGFLGIAATIMAVLLLCFDIGRFAFEWRTYPSPGFAALAWLLLAGLLVGLAFASRSAGDTLSPWIGGALMGGLGGVVALDALAVWGGGDLARDLTAAPATALVLLAMVGVRSSRSIILAAGGLGLVLAVLVLASWAGSTRARGRPRVRRRDDGRPRGAAAGGRGPDRARLPADGQQRARPRARAVHGLRAPRFAVGMLASEELARLDLAAEDLLDVGRDRPHRAPARPEDRVGRGVSSPPSCACTSSRAAGETWLYHAVTRVRDARPVRHADRPESASPACSTRTSATACCTAVWLLHRATPASAHAAARHASRSTSPSARRARRGHGERPDRRADRHHDHRRAAQPRRPGDVGRHAQGRAIQSTPPRGRSLRVEIDCVRRQAQPTQLTPHRRHPRRKKGVP